MNLLLGKSLKIVYLKEQQDLLKQNGAGMIFLKGMSNI